MLPLEVLDIPGEIKVGYSPIGFVRCGRAACRVTKVLWKIGKETGGKKMEEPHSLKSNEMAEVHAGLAEILACLIENRRWQCMSCHPESSDLLADCGSSAIAMRSGGENSVGGAIHPAAAARRGHVQELRGPVAHCVPGWQRRGHRECSFEFEMNYSARCVFEALLFFLLGGLFRKYCSVTCSAVSL